MAGISSKIPIPEDVFTHSFAMQYITLILFILIVSIGAFLPKNRIEKAEPPKPVLLDAERAKAPPETILSKTIELSKLQSANNENFAPYITLLKNHDLHLIVTIDRNEQNSASADRISAQIYEHLKRQGLPAESFIIQTKYRAGPVSQIQMEVLKGAEAWE